MPDTHLATVGLTDDARHSPSDSVGLTDDARHSPSDSVGLTDDARHSPSDIVCCAGLWSETVTRAPGRLATWTALAQVTTQ
ncbi:hypothetical protein RRG08_015421 [Elysia crispata]|uniref:Uncharacterized protein n=1 Tax=Elysia crispata TaxID=231223 RepID=A0AAE0YI58_9GAST|nr:hypothetical protein RRG08_015421 [Elysia crispata]